MPETRGLMKALVEADGDRILGFTMLGAEAGKVMAVVHTRWWRLCPTRAYATRLSMKPLSEINVMRADPAAQGKAVDEIKKKYDEYFGF